MKRFLLLTIAFAALAVPTVVLAGGDSGFDGIVRSIEGRYHVRANHIPFMGLISLVSNKATHGGVNGLRLAEFDAFTEPVDGNELNAMVEQKLGPAWERMIRETSRSGHNQTLIFVHPDGDKMAMLVVDLDGSEMNIVQVSVDPKHLDDDLGQYRHHAHKSDQTQDDNDDSGNTEN